jgi:hypothetical protein
MNKEPLFILYRGPLQFRLVPRTGKGVAIFAGWLLALLAPLPLIVWLAQERSMWFLPVYFILFAAGLIALIRYAMARAEVVDLGELARDLKEFREWREREKGRR